MTTATGTTKRIAHEYLKLTTIGRTRFRGVDWVVYDDGAYRIVVKAEHYDREIEPTDDGEEWAAYDYWCSSDYNAMFADDETAVKVARKLSLVVVHSAHGCAALYTGFDRDGGSR